MRSMEAELIAIVLRPKRLGKQSHTKLEEYPSPSLLENREVFNDGDNAECGGHTASVDPFTFYSLKVLPYKPPTNVIMLGPALARSVTTYGRIQS